MIVANQKISSNQNQEIRWLGQRPATWLSWVICLSSLILAPAGLILENLNIPYRDLLKVRTYPIQALYAVSLPIVGALIITFKPKQPIGWLLSVAGGLMAIATASRQYAVYGLITNPGSLPIGNLVGWCYLWSWMVADILTLLIFLLFPTGYSLTRRWRWLLWLAGIGGSLIVIPVAVLSWGFRGVRLVTIKPNEMMGSSMALVLLGVGLIVIVALGSVISLVVRFRRARGEERFQLKWFVYAVVLFTFAASINFIAYATENNLFIDLLNILTYLTFSWLIASIAIAILKYHLYDIDILINRTLVYGSLTAGVAGLYILMVVGLGSLLRTENNLVSSLVATIVIALLFQPLRQRLQRAVNRLIFGQRDEPYRVLSTLGQRLETLSPPNELLPGIIETIAHSLKLPFAQIEWQTDATNQTIIGYGEASQDYKLWRVPLVYQAETVGELALAPRGRGEEFSPADQHLLQDLSRQLGVAVHAVRLTHDLQRSRAKLVTTREEERRRLRRDLHDGLGPSLAALNLQAGTIRSLISSNPTAAQTMIEEWRIGLKASIAEIRRLVYELRPPALDELGLVGAIRDYVGKYESSSGLAFEIIAPDQLLLLPAAVEVAAYRIVQEAITNVLKHSQAAKCQITFQFEAVLTVIIEDNGTGIADMATKGVGMISMRERAEELGGSCIIENLASSGTRVVARLPLPEN
jgi:signal transduction histidine kinase